jgi:DNA polymerase
MGGPLLHFYGGKLTENVTQAVARDVFVNGYVNLIEAGYHIPFTVHDESDIEAPNGADTEEIKRCVIDRPSWFASCPLDTDVDVVDHYTK